MTRRCPWCDAKLEGIKTDWVLSDREINGHQVATIGTTHNAKDDICAAAEFQIAANLAAYDLDWDFELNLGFQGTAWVQCPEARDQIGPICWAK